MIIFIDKIIPELEAKKKIATTEAKSLCVKKKKEHLDRYEYNYIKSWTTKREIWTCQPLIQEEMLNVYNSYLIYCII